MPVTINGTTGIDIVQPSAVFSATAGATSGSVGTYGWLRQDTGSTATVGSTRAGSSLQWSDGGDWNSGVYATGTWMAMGSVRSGWSCLWLRIS